MHSDPFLNLCRRYGIPDNKAYLVELAWLREQLTEQDKILGELWNEDDSKYNSHNDVNVPSAFLDAWDK